MAPPIAFVAYDGGLGPAVANLPAPDGSGKTLGDLGVRDRPKGPSVPEVMQAWAQRNHCEGKATEKQLAADVTELTFACPAGAEVELYRVDGGGHSWPGSAFSKQIERGRPTDGLDLGQRGHVGLLPDPPAHRGRTVKTLDDAPFLDIFDRGFQADAAPVLDRLRAESWLARTPIGGLVIGREQVQSLMADRRLRSSLLDFLHLQGVTDGILHDRMRRLVARHRRR